MSITNAGIYDNECGHGVQRAQWARAQDHEHPLHQRPPAQSSQISRDPEYEHPTQPKTGKPRNHELVGLEIWGQRTHAAWPAQSTPKSATGHQPEPRKTPNKPAKKQSHANERIPRTNTPWPVKSGVAMNPHIPLLLAHGSPTVDPSRKSPLKPNE